MEIKVDNDSIQKIVEGTIKAKVVEALAGQSEYVISRIVDAALNAKDPRGYGRETIFESQMNEALRVAAVAAAQEWLNEQKPAIRELVRRKLDSKKAGLIASIADQLVGGFRNGVRVQVWFAKDE